MPNAGAERARLRLIIRGRVQGVGFRFSVQDEAMDLALTGWARNLASGAVEIVAEGRRDRLQVLAAWAHQGPRLARVTEVVEEWLDFAGEFADFRIR